MHSSTSSSDKRFFVALATTICVLGLSWEGVLRQRASAALDVGIDTPALTPIAARGEQWVIFGNCLMMTGVSPRRLNDELAVDSNRVITNIAWHEQSPIAFFDYLRRAGDYPDVVIANVSSWLNGTNFEQEGALVSSADPLHLNLSRGGGSAAPSEAAVTSARAQEQAFRQDGEAGSGQFQREAEAQLSKWASGHVHALGHRYHLFDYMLFVGKLATTADLDVALYQLNMQSWFRVSSSETDGSGYLGLQVRYRDDWSSGLDQMAERSLQRMRLSHLLTAQYWSLLEADVREFQSHGTQVFLVRMPEHPRIRAFNDETYALPEHVRALEERTGTPFLDLSRLGPADGVHLFDAVHPDAKAAEVITRQLGVWLRAHIKSRDASARGTQ